MQSTDLTFIPIIFKSAVVKISELGIELQSERKLKVTLNLLVFLAGRSSKSYFYYDNLET